MQIRPDYYLDEDKDCDNVGIERMSVTYCQLADCNKDNIDEYNTITISTETAGVGDLPYYFTIKTDRWTINEPSEMEKLAEDFIKRLKGE